MKNLILGVVALLASFSVMAPDTSAALSFQQPSNYDDNSRCQRSFDRYVGVVSEAWQLRIDDALNSTHHGKRLRKLDRRASRLLKRFNRYCTF